MVPLQRCDRLLYSNMRAELLLGAAFPVEHSLDYFQEVLQGFLGLVRPGQRGQGRFDVGLHPVRKRSRNDLP